MLSQPHSRVDVDRNLRDQIAGMNQWVVTKQELHLLYIQYRVLATETVPPGRVHSLSPTSYMMSVLDQRIKPGPAQFNRLPVPEPIQYDPQPHVADVARSTLLEVLQY